MSAFFDLPIPELETQRLVLRAPRKKDFAAHVEFMASDRAKYVGGPQDRPDAWRGYCSGIGHWVLRGYGMWMIADKKDDTPLGRVGFIYHEGWDEPELGWHLYVHAEGKGIAFEATRAARAFGAQEYKLDGVISYIAPLNTRSIALATRLGARFERDGELLGKVCQVWRHPAEGSAA
ncbi:GNAT family N-acetyltransferase [Epibacterium sp. SM1979]|uniref:GNAT family N-acetyltransferase n=1 Tax=Tritonibacter litoralis TaxID=2662264 RepID=A0A843YG22_9RHOB|nr:GNAT family N-acetyltransferase [Tritonibacter litoralis]MQQ08625.1 GNAT family N-acetyltransferase [Tritonibacter litoralis]